MVLNRKYAQGGGMTIEQDDTSGETAAPENLFLSPDAVPRRQNQLLALGLVFVAIVIFAVMLTIVMLFHTGRILTRGRLLRAVWGAAYGDEGHYLHVYVSRLRRKLDAADPSGGASGLIVAEPGVGYRFAV
jgi:DNA-binding winged helix-turn-helix (wHTH) protein